MVDDGSADGTSGLLAAVGDPRLVVLRNDERLGSCRLAEPRARCGVGAVRRAARRRRRRAASPAPAPARGDRLEPCPRARRLGGARAGRAGPRPATHVMPTGAAAVRWHAHFSSPFLHPTVVFDRELLERHGLRYDERFGESEDYDLWARLLDVERGRQPRGAAGPLPRPSRARRRGGGGTCSASFQREVALRQIVADRARPRRRTRRARMARRRRRGVAARRPSRRPSTLPRAARALRGRSYGERRSLGLRVVRAAAARRCRVAARAGRARARFVRRALALRPSLALDAALRARSPAGIAPRGRRARGRGRAGAVAAAPPGLPRRSASPSSRPSRRRTDRRLFDRVAARPEVDLTVLYAGRTVAGRTWEIEPRHRAVYPRRRPRSRAVRRLLRHEYPVTPGIFARAGRTRTRTSSSSRAGARSRHRPPSPGAAARRRAVRAARREQRPRPAAGVAAHHQAPRRAAGRASRGDWVLTVGHAGTRLGARPRRTPGAAPAASRTRSTSAAYVEQAERLVARREDLRCRLGAGADDLVVLLGCAARAGEGARHARPRGRCRRPSRVLARPGRRRRARTRPPSTRLARELGVRAASCSATCSRASRVVELYAGGRCCSRCSRTTSRGASSSTRPPPAALPLLLSDRVGAAHDLLRDGENGLSSPPAT